MYPRQAPSTHTEILDEEVCVYDWERKEVHALNPTAARVWRLCDGDTSEEEMVARLESEWGKPEAVALVRLALEELAAKHLLAGEAEPAAAVSTLSRRQLIKGLGLAAATLPVITSIVAPTPLEAASANASHGSQTLTYTGAQQTFKVPLGVTSLTITAGGAQGGDGGLGSVGGLGGSITATVAVTPNETLYVFVGGAGGTGTPTLGGSAGFNGGGIGGGAWAGGGGGGSDVRQGGAALANRIVIAGAGGGAGAGASTTYSFGGAGGGLTGGTGGADATGAALGGGGGTQIQGGDGGTGPSAQGNPGGPGVGGDGVSTGAASGGGGGGYYGGGSGGDNSGAAGGGGGSSYSEPGATNVTNTQGGHTGNGQVVISW